MHAAAKEKENYTKKSSLCARSRGGDRRGDTVSPFVKNVKRVFVREEKARSQSALAQDRRRRGGGEEGATKSTINQLVRAKTHGESSAFGIRARINCYLARC